MRNSMDYLGYAGMIWDGYMCKLWSMLTPRANRAWSIIKCIQDSLSLWVSKCPHNSLCPACFYISGMFPPSSDFAWPFGVNCYFQSSWASWLMVNWHRHIEAWQFQLQTQTSTNWSGKPGPKMERFFKKCGNWCLWLICNWNPSATKSHTDFTPSMAINRVMSQRKVG